MGRVIVELLPSHGHKVERRYVFDNGSATIGRSYSNDIILDDPFVSPQHLVISANGKMVYVRDLASENGTEIVGSAPLMNQVAKIQSGEEICVGKTKLKILLPGHPVEPAKRMDNLAALRSFLDRWSVAAVFSLFVMGIFVWASYMEQPSDKFWEKEVFGIVWGYLLLALIYVGLLGVITHSRIHRAYFKRYLALSNAGILLSYLHTEVGPFWYFGVFNNGLIAIAEYVISFGVMLVMLWASARLTKDFVTRKEVIKFAGITLVLIVLTAWSTEDIKIGFSAKPSYPTQLAPYLKPWSESLPLDSFLKDSGPEIFKPVDSADKI